MSDNGNEWRKFRVVPRLHPCVPWFVLRLIGVEAEGLVDYQGTVGIMSIVWWNLRPVIFGVEPQPYARTRAGPQCSGNTLDHASLPYRATVSSDCWTSEWWSLLSQTSFSLTFHRVCPCHIAQRAEGKTTVSAELQMPLPASSSMTCFGIRYIHGFQTRDLLDAQEQRALQTLADKWLSQCVE